MTNTMKANKRNTGYVPPHVEERRSAVARMLAAKATLRQIVAALPKTQVPIINPETQEPWGLTTIHDDVVYLKREWRNRANMSTDEWLQEEVSSIDELERQGWTSKDYDLVVKCKQLRSKLLGLEAPTRVKIEYAMPAELQKMIEAKGIPVSDIWANMMQVLGNDANK